MTALSELDAKAQLGETFADYDRFVRELVTAYRAGQLVERQAGVVVPVEKLRALIDEARHQMTLREQYQDTTDFDAMANELIAAAQGRKG